MVARALANQGCDVTVIEVLWRHYRQQATLPAWTGQQAAFADAIEGRGRILAASQQAVDRRQLLRAVCDRFGDQTICVAVNNTVTAQQLAAYLAGRVPQTVHTGMDCSPDSRAQVHLIPMRGFALPFACSVAVAFGTSAAVSSLVRRVVRSRRNIVRVGLLSAGLRSLRYVDQVAVEAMYGPCLFDAEMPASLLPIHVAIMPASSYPASDEQSAYSRKQSNFWTNQNRNRRIAHLATRLQRRETTCLQAAGIDDLATAIPQPADSQSLRVAIIVESPEHAREMSSQLPGWRVTDRTTASGSFGIEADGDIVTLPAAHAAGLTAEVVINASGAGDRWIDACGGMSWHSGSMQLVVDFADDFDDAARDDVASRADDYRSRGWTVHWPGTGVVSVFRPTLADIGPVESIN
ncbi:MAG: hypothetical protein C0485_09565 [Pirellula sp.]|nr:hypothetical protein [Pirellula sp.]